ncbi:MAG: type II toxin-antitoxin system RelE/ParE family toxin [Candidatus Absconditabacteria bacterium]
MRSVPNSNEINKFKSLNFEKLNNYKDGDYSIRVNNQYRIIFNILKGNKIEIIEIIDLIDYH